MAADFTTVPTVDLLTRAADAAGKAVAACEVEAPDDSEMVGPAEMYRTLRGVGCQPGAARMLAASNPDLWRAVEALFRNALERHGPIRSGGYTVCGTCDIQFTRNGCDALQAFRPLAAQVLRDLGDTP